MYSIFKNLLRSTLSFGWADSQIAAQKKEVDTTKTEIGVKRHNM